ncbi:MAG: sulfite exporter TauE/SafE family protein [Pseudomonadota bacterium]
MIGELGWTLFAAISVAALLTGILHGATGMAGGIVMASILAHLIGIKAAVPVMNVALILSHLSRALMYARDTDWAVAARVLCFSVPTIIAGAIVFGMISPATVAIVFATFLVLSFPIKFWARTHDVKTGPGLLAGASMVWGMLAGNVIGPGFFLAPFLLGTGMSRMTFVGTLAAITLVMNIIKSGVFLSTSLLDTELALLGAWIGLISVPGNWIGRTILKRIKDSDHRRAIDVMTVLMIINFIYLAVK